jgi:hypothetical protein
MKRTSYDYNRDRILDRNMDRKKDESCMIITETGSLTGTWTGKR